MFYETLNLNLKIISTLMIFNTFSYIKSHNEKMPGLIYILPWTDGSREPFVLWSEKQDSFIKNNCSYQNCYIVKDRGYFQDSTNYDVILFSPIGLGAEDLPMARSDNQLYVFTCVEPAAYLPLGENWNWFFNYTWTYRLDSDLRYPFFFVRNRHGEIVGPKINARWRSIYRMRPTGKYIIGKLQSKTTAAVWFVTRCIAMNGRAAYAHGISEALNKYNMSVDFYGACGNKYCPKHNSSHCSYLMEKYYYFFFAFENSNCEDYVTEKLLNALMHYTVPVIMGGGNYSSFMPNGIYLDGNILSQEEVAETIKEAIQNKQKYYDYFRWHRYYTYRPAEGGNTDPLCAFCAFLNDDSKRGQRRVYSRIDKWWNNYRSQHGTEDFIENYMESASYIKSVISYKEPKIKVETVSTPSILENVNSFLGDIFRYFFPN